MGIIGVGMVGSQLHRYFEEERGHVRRKDLFLYDANPKKDMQDDINQAHLIFVCVPTPWKKNGVCDISAVKTALGMISGEKVVVLKSTVPPGTTERLQKKFPKLALLFSPEFLTESRAWEDMVRPDRQIVSATAKAQPHASTVLGLLPTAFFSSPGTLGTYNFIRINATEAEVGKYASNIFGALKVTYANMLADICFVLENSLKKEGMKDATVQYKNVRSILAHDRRIGDAWLDVEHNLYRGFGGACLPKDMSAFIVSAKSLLAKLPRKTPEWKRFLKLIAFFEAAWAYNETLLQSQGLSVEDVSIHDKEWLGRKLAKNIPKRKEA